MVTIPKKQQDGGDESQINPVILSQILKKGTIIESKFIKQMMLIYTGGDHDQRQMLFQM